MLIQLIFVGVLGLASVNAPAQSLQLTNKVPACKSTAGKPLPAAYYRPQDGKDFAWVDSVSAADAVAGGPGWERYDGSGLHDWFEFYRLDIDNDGFCDWFINMQAPGSSGGDRDSLNTLYLRRGRGWMRVGATIPVGKPDVLGLGKTWSEQNAYLFGEDVGVIHDTVKNVNYIITAFYQRNTQHRLRPGYRLFVWDAKLDNLKLLDKWQIGSAAAQVYAFFKINGAWRPHNARDADEPDKFQPEIEAAEIRQACDPASDWRTAPDLYGTVPPNLIARCPR